MTDWVRFPSGQYNLIDEKHPQRIAWVRKSSRGWDWIIQDATGRQIDCGACRTASGARARAVSRIACEGILGREVGRFQ